MKKIFLVSLFAILSLNLSGCVNKTLNTAQKESIKSVAINKPIIQKDAQRELDVGGQSNVQDTVGAAGGLIGSLIGAVVDSAIKSSRRSDFENKYLDKMTKVNSIKIDNVDSSIKEKLTKVLTDNHFFSDKIQGSSENILNSEITAYGLVRLFEDKGTIYIGAAMDSQIKLINGDNIILEKFIPTKSSSAYTIDELVENENLIEELYNEVYSDFEEKFSIYINEATKTN